ncbi:hypothetical protein H6F76_04110 [Leptolyngbya sp. FACHB-321]|uniref:hypothetical protein n=1 Tax=Leptolyngbya sp. FACHB-321 TaxID=2692807 RepID=UPI001683C9E6|nr:hypothetical protein [Leptolyngbya sp. FACHB-321]MBD2034232.1 hypothetical protein [Leptolyngbya sp. FACHB-321]
MYEQKEDGSRHGTVFRSGVAPVLRLFANDVEWTVTPEISEEKKARLEAERLAREYQDKLALVSSRVLPAFRDERALKVHRFLQQELTPLRMGHIMDLIKADLGGELNNLASKNELSRFFRSINHPEVFGNDSRHITSNEKPPTNPMSLSEAQGFVSRIADLWFKQKCVEANNA